MTANTPPIQNSGMAETITGSSCDPVTARIAAGHVEVCRTRVPWVCSTPFGSAVDPDVCTMMARSAADTSASAAASTSAPTRSSVSSAHRVAQATPAPEVSAMRRRNGATGSDSRSAR